MSNNNKTGGLFSKGYYIALILCAVAVGITGYVYYRNAQQQPPAPAMATEGEKPVMATIGQDEEPGREEIPVMATQPSKDPATQSTQSTQSTEPGQTQPTKPKVLRTAAPVQGERVMGYSMEALSYNQTTRDWRVHNGIDLAAEAGTPVLAAAQGTVYTIYEDDSLGTTVVIRHEGGYTTCYSSLSKELKVKVGDKVSLGQTIGTVGTTALVETVLGPHVHFSVTWQEQPMDPADFLALG